MQRVTLTILLLMLNGVSFGQNDIRPSHGLAIDFFREEITLSVSDSTADISGIYYFRNNTDLGKPFPVLFPFNVDQASLYPYKIAAFIVTGTDTVRLPTDELKSRDGISLKIPMTPDSTTVWHLAYSQKILSPHARYILRSTAAWGSPLREATYKFIVPASFDSVRVRPEADSVVNQGNRKVHWCHKMNFMPIRDMEISWKTK
jgi:hypothetical protein